MSKSNIDYLRDLPPFKDLTEKRFSSLAKYLRTVSFPKDHIIFNAGDAGDRFYVIKKGTVRVFIQAPESGENIVLSNLTEGDYFGEMALLTGKQRSASIETVTDVSLLELDKEGFDKLLEEDPKISISISHMISQRLEQANLQRAASEQFYKSKISPSGSLEDHPILEILKFCEENSLTGVLRFEHDDKKAELSFIKGVVQKILMGDLSDAEAMDNLTQWQEGKFKIEPSLFSIEEDVMHDQEKDENKKINSVKKEKRSTENIPVLLENFLKRSFTKLIDLVGSQKLKDITAKSQQQCIPFFPTLKECTFEVVPELKVDLKNKNDWTDKETLAVAVFLEKIFKDCQSLVFGMSYLNLENLASENSEHLKEISFFEYMAHAKEFTL
jgi:CRP-like cAMP-binding protein